MPSSSDQVETTERVLAGGPLSRKRGLLDQRRIVAGRAR
jgi:hypothetical protein